MWGVSLRSFQLMHLNMAHSMVCLVLGFFSVFKNKKTGKIYCSACAGIPCWCQWLDASKSVWPTKAGCRLAPAAVAQSVQVQPVEHLEWLFKTYRYTLEDVELWAVKFLDFIICWNRDWYETEVLGEQDDQHCGPVHEKNWTKLATALIINFKEMNNYTTAG